MPKAGWAAVAAAGLVLALAALDLGAWAYTRHAEARLDRLPDERVAASAAIAAKLAPWAARSAALGGWVHAQERRQADAQAAYLRALRWAPGDPLMWAEYALALGRTRVFDERLTWATQRALELAPASPAVRESVAAMGLTYWRHGSEPLRELWRQSLRWQLDHSRASFLREVDDGGYRIAFCLHHAEALGEKAWCQGPG